MNLFIHISHTKIFSPLKFIDARFFPTIAALALKPSVTFFHTAQTIQ